MKSAIIDQQSLNAFWSLKAIAKRLPPIKPDLNSNQVQNLKLCRAGNVVLHLAEDSDVLFKVEAQLSLSQVVQIARGNFMKLFPTLEFFFRYLVTPQLDSFEVSEVK